jgi:hypothetical protein
LKDIIFIYRDKFLGDEFESLATKICKILRNHLTLPEPIEIESISMGPSIYGQLLVDPRFKKRIRINSDLALNELKHPLVHELIHLHQITTNQLDSRRDGSYLWEGQPYKIRDAHKLSYAQYQELPWELDVAQKQHKFLKLLQENNIN